MRSSTAICGLGITDMGRVYRSAQNLAIEAVHLALADAGLEKSDLDGLLVNSGVTPGVDLQLHQALGLQDLNLLTYMQGYGSSAAQMIEYAAMAVHNGQAKHVCCVFADSPLQQDKRTGAAYSNRHGSNPITALMGLYGFAGANAMYALGAQRHMDLYGTTQEQLGQVAISQRQWAAHNERATKREPLDMQAYHESPWVVEPFHVLDCCLVSNGGVAVIVTTADRARDLKQPPAYLRGFAQGHHHDTGFTNTDPLVRGPGEKIAAKALAMADANIDDVSQCQLYDCYTYTVIETLEDYGFCKKGEGGPFVEDGKLGPGGSLPTNTGGGSLSSYYMWGMTPVSEGVIQARGHGGTRQATNDLVLVTGNGGILNYQAALLLSPTAA
ncbi:MAG: thiolase family protein [Proteobacteria bacterium]|nr:thiolase family protein [Pseudomonadota bacterium]